MRASRFFSAITIASFLIAFNRLEFTSQNFFHIAENLRQLEVVSVEDAIGPESFEFDTLDGGPYTGISDGRIVKWQKNERRWIDFAVTSPSRDGCEGPVDNHVEKEHMCGRPLGLCFNKSNGDLYIADAYMGLLRVGTEGGLATRLAKEAHGVPFRFCNGLDIDHFSQVVYFTDSSSQYQRRNYISVILSGDRTGRLMKYDPNTGEVTVLLDNLSFPNGVALSQDGNYLLFAETTSCTILKYWLRTSKIGTVEVIAKLPGFPDNIKRSPRGGFWIGVYPRQRISKWALSFPWIGNALLRLPIDIMKVHSSLAKLVGNGGTAMRLSEDGNVLEMLQDKDITSKWSSVSEVEEKDDTLWIGSVNMPFVGIYKNTTHQ